MMNIIAASRLKKQEQPEPNTFIGNVADLVPDETTLASFLSDVSASDIKAFEILDNNIRCFIDVNYIPVFSESTPIRNMTYYVDLQGNINQSSGSWRVGQEIKYSLNFLYLPMALSVPEFAFRTTRGQALLALQRATNLGGSPLNNLVFRGAGTSVPAHRLTIDSSQETINSGNPDLDITGSGFGNSLIENGGTVTYSTDKTNPPASTISATTNIGGTFIELNVSQPTHVNSLKYALVFVDGFFRDVHDINNVLLINLQEQTSYNIKVITADEYFNISPYSNTINVTTLSNDITITEITTGVTYTEFSITNITPFTFTEIEVYVDGVLNTISNKYAVNLNELNSYNIDVIAKTSEGANLISNTINVTTILKSNYTISQNTIGSTYVLLNENYIAPNETKTVEVYANGVLSNTITNAIKGSVYLANLNELTNYDIYLIIEGNKSNTINLTTTTTPELYQNAAAYLKLNETSGYAIDLVNGYKGTLFGGVTQGVAGKIGTAYSFDGVDGYLNLGDNNDFTFTDGTNDTSFTLRCWVKLNNNNDTQNFFNKTFNSNLVEYNFRLINQKLRCSIYSENKANISRTVESNNNIDLTSSLNQIAVTFNDSNLEMKIYLNGVEVSSAISDNGYVKMNNTTSPLFIGKNGFNSSQYVNGVIDEAVIIKGEAWTAGKVLDDFNNNNGTTI